MMSTHIFPHLTLLIEKFVDKEKEILRLIIRIPQRIGGI